MNKPIILNFVVDKELLNEIEEFWHEMKLPTRAEATRELIRLGLQKHRENKVNKDD